MRAPYPFLARRKPAKAKRRFRLWRKRQEPSLFIRCLAIHIDGAGKIGALK
jgi:hypothetical protein